MQSMDDVQLRALGKRIANIAILSAEKATGHTAEPTKFLMPTQKDALENIFLDRFKTLDPDRQKAARVRVMGSLLGTEDYRKGMFGDLAAVKLYEAKPVADLATKLTFPKELKLEKTKLEAFAKLYKPLQVPTVLAAKPRYNRVQLRVHEVKCMDETNPEWWGDDEIDLGGNYIDKMGNVQVIPRFRVSSSFDDGEVKRYAPPRNIANIDMGTENIWPKYLTATLCLAEVDMGGFAEFLNRLAAKLEELVKSYLGAAIGTAIGGAIGGWIGAAVGFILGYVLDRIFEWLKSWWSDDVFPPKTIQLQVDNPYEFPNHRLDTNDVYAYFNGHGGSYRVKFDWCLN